MKHLKIVTVLLAITGLSFALGMTYSSMTETIIIPECDILDIEKPVAEAYCEISATSPEIIYEQVPIYVEKECDITECDCIIEVNETWNSCVRSYESATSQKEKNRTKILPRNYRR